MHVMIKPPDVKSQGSSVHPLCCRDATLGLDHTFKMFLKTGEVLAEALSIAVLPCVLANGVTRYTIMYW